MRLAFWPFDLLATLRERPRYANGHATRSLSIIIGFQHCPPYLKSVFSIPYSLFPIP
ncbi:MAG: hypothetical protein F6K55_11765 [Moorea sp. SIO4A3]|nr:hypothetical protein [Moorena sp. SIO4A3]